MAIPPSFLTPIRFIQTGQGYSFIHSVYTLIDCHFSRGIKYAQIQKITANGYDLAIEQDISKVKDYALSTAKVLQCYTHLSVVAELARIAIRRLFEVDNPIRTSMENRYFTSLVRAGSLVGLGMVIAKICLRSCYNFTITRENKLKNDPDEVNDDID